MKRDSLFERLKEGLEDCSYGFRPGKSAHDAIRELDRVMHRGGGNWVLEFDVKSFFDSIDRKMLMKMLQ